MNNKIINLKFERAKTTKALSNFYCGVPAIDHFVQNELEDFLNFNDFELYLVKENDEIIAFFCLNFANLFIEDAIRNKMKKGIKPKPSNFKINKSAIENLLFRAIEITYLAVKKEKRGLGIGKFIIHEIKKFVKKKKTNEDFIIVRALNTSDYSSIPFYRKCGFSPAEAEKENKNLFMYLVID